MGDWEALGNALIVLVFFLFLVIIYSIIAVIACWKLFKKAGKNGWEAIIPFYSSWVLVEIAGLNWWWFLILMSSTVVSIVGLDSLEGIANIACFFASFNCYYNIAKKFNKSTGYAICSGLFSFIFVLILGFSKNEVYNGNIPVSKNGVIGTPDFTEDNYNYNANTSNDYMNNNQNVSSNGENNFCGNCGKQLSVGTKFCPNCGKQIN